MCLLYVRLDWGGGGGCRLIHNNQEQFMIFKRSHEVYLLKTSIPNLYDPRNVQSDTMFDFQANGKGFSPQYVPPEAPKADF